MTSSAVWKYEVKITGRPSDVIEIEMPARSEILRVGSQHDVPVLWALVNPHEDEREVRRILAVPTGYEVHERVHWLGAADLHAGEIVCNVFEVMG